jgi:hypothetical protein
MRIALLISVLSTGACAAQTPFACPWLSTGSAATVLGGPVTVSAHVEGNQQGTCRFTRESDGKLMALEITIGKEDTHLCPPGSMKLVALGNEAVQCKSVNAKGLWLDVIAGRIRNLYFAVSTGNVLDAATVPSVPARPLDPYGASVLERVTEQVVGNLY